MNPNYVMYDFFAIDEEREREEKMKITRRTRKIFERPEPEHLPNGLQNWIEEHRGGDLRFIYQKYLDTTDVNMNNNRLSIPVRRVQSPEFLTEYEKERVKEREVPNRRSIRGLEVRVVDQSLREYNLRLKQWDMKKCSVYNLLSGWSQVVRDNNLQINTKVQLWSFRLQSQLCFALVKVPEEEEGLRDVDGVDLELRL